MFWITMTPKHANLFPTVFLQFHLEEMWGMDECKLGEELNAIMINK